MKIEDVVTNLSYKKLGNLRYGQALWNEFVSNPKYKQKCEEIKGTEADCFYNDKNIEPFLLAMKEVDNAQSE